jgi:hypothetical protein
MESQNVAINESSKSLIENIKDMIDDLRCYSLDSSSPKRVDDYLPHSVRSLDRTKSDENYQFLGNVQTNKENVVISKEMISKEENNEKFIENHIYLISPN